MNGFEIPRDIQGLEQGNNTLKQCRPNSTVYSAPVPFGLQKEAEKKKKEKKNYRGNKRKRRGDTPRCLF